MPDLTGRKQLQAQRGTSVQHQLDDLAIARLQFLQQFTLQFTDRPASQSVILRRAIEHYCDHIDKLIRMHRDYGENDAWIKKEQRRMNSLSLGEEIPKRMFDYLEDPNEAIPRFGDILKRFTVKSQRGNLIERMARTRQPWEYAEYGQ